MKESHLKYFSWNQFWIMIHSVGLTEFLVKNCKSTVHKCSRIFLQFLLNKNFVKSKLNYLPKNMWLDLTIFFFQGSRIHTIWKFTLWKYFVRSTFYMLIDHSVNWFHGIFFKIEINSLFTLRIYENCCFSVKSQFIFPSNWNKKS